MSLFSDKVLQKKRDRLRAKTIETLQIGAVFVALIPLTIHHFWPRIFSKKPITTHINTYTEKDGMPNLFYFGGETWDIIVDAEGGQDEWLTENHADAATICADHAVVIRSTLPKSVRIDSLFHEFLHVGTCGMGSQDEQSRYYNSYTMADHNGYERIAVVYTGIFRENPELGRYMASDK